MAESFYNNGTDVIVICASNQSYHYDGSSAKRRCVCIMHKRL